MLAAGVHPYHYNTPDNGVYWRNYYHEYGSNRPAGPCGDLGLMLDTWLNSLSGAPVFFTEDNWTSNSAPTLDCQNNNGCEGTYIADLFTYLQDSPGYYTNPQASPIRVEVYRGADDVSGGHPLGIYHDGTTRKEVQLNVCNNSGINNAQTSIDNIYYQLRHAACY